MRRVVLLVALNKSRNNVRFYSEYLIDREGKLYFMNGFIYFLFYVSFRDNYRF